MSNRRVVAIARVLSIVILAAASGSKLAAMDWSAIPPWPWMAIVAAETGLVLGLAFARESDLPPLALAGAFSGAAIGTLSLLGGELSAPCRCFGGAELARGHALALQGVLVVLAALMLGAKAVDADGSA